LQYPSIPAAFEPEGLTVPPDRLRAWRAGRGSGGWAANWWLEPSRSHLGAAGGAAAEGAPRHTRAALVAMVCVSAPPASHRPNRPRPRRAGDSRAQRQQEGNGLLPLSRVRASAAQPACGFRSRATCSCGLPERAEAAGSWAGRGLSGCVARAAAPETGVRGGWPGRRDLGSNLVTGPLCARGRASAASSRIGGRLEDGGSRKQAG
jgi:hypothetical protein